MEKNGRPRSAVLRRLCDHAPSPTESSLAFRDVLTGLRPTQQVRFSHFLTNKFMGDAATREDQNPIRVSQH